MKKKIKKSLLFLFSLLGLTQLFFHLRFRKKNQILILLYHRVRISKNPFEIAVSPENFSVQLEFLKKHFDVVSLREALRRKENNRLSSKPLAVITFDDGYRDNFENAHPLLKKYSLPAVFFLTAGSIGNRAPMWTSRVEALFKNTSQQDLALATLSPPRRYKLGNFEKRMSVCFEVKNEMKKVPDERRRMILEELEEKAGNLSLEKDEIASEMLSWEEVRRLAKDPLVEIGSHSLSHRMLAHLSSEEVARELEESKKMIEAEIGRAVNYFSYPGNSYNLEVKRLAQRAGYKGALAVDRSLCSFDEDNFALKRVHVEDGPLYFFQAEISLTLSILRSLLNLPKLGRGETQ